MAPQPPLPPAAAFAAGRPHPAEEAAGSSALPAFVAGAAPADKAAGASAHIQVAVRVRPVPPGDASIIEVAGEGAIAVRKEAATGGNEYLSSQQGRTEERIFDRVFGPCATQEEVNAWSCRPLVISAIQDGRNATIFVYGATGAGKTHTMFGEREEAQQGLIYRAVREALAIVEARASSGFDKRPLQAKVSFLDIYNETVRDLLQEQGGGLCRVLEDERRGIVKVANLKEVPVSSADDALRLVRVGMQARKVEATAANARSSRSHAVFSLTLERVESAAAGPGNPVFQRRAPEVRRVHSRISLIDLAGSERATQTQNTGSALKDGAKINQSLLALANCIDALVYRNQAKEGTQTPRKKAPYRDSKLTLLLKSSLTSDCLVSMIANVHPGRDHFEDSNNTLEYAKRASVVKAPVLVRRARANSLSFPVTHPESSSPSPSPSLSPRSRVDSPGEDEVVSPVPPGAPLCNVAPKKYHRTGTPDERRRAGAQRQQLPSKGASAVRSASALLPGPASARRAKSEQAAAEQEAAGPSRRQLREQAAAALEAAGPKHCEAKPPGSSVFTFAPKLREARQIADAGEIAGGPPGELSFMTPPSPTPLSLPGTSPRAEKSLCSLEDGAGSPREPSLLDIVEAAPQADASAMPCEEEVFTPVFTPPSGTESLNACPDAVVSLETVSSDTRLTSTILSSEPCRHPTADTATDMPPETKVKAEPEEAAARGFSHSEGGRAAATLDTSMLLCLTEQLQAEKEQLDARLSAVTADREKQIAVLTERLAAITADRESLEAENAKLRAANLRKDRQMAVILARLHGDSVAMPSAAA